MLSTFSMVIVITTIWSYCEVREDLNELLDAQLVDAAHLLISLFLTTQQELKLSPSQTFQKEYMRQLLDHSHIWQSSTEKLNIHRVFQIWGTQGRLLFRSPHAPSLPLAEQRPGFHLTHFGPTQWRVFTLIDPSLHIILQIAQRDDLRHRLRFSLIQTQLLGTIIGYPLFFLMIWWIVGWSLKPLLRIKHAIEQRQPDHLMPIILENIPTEVLPLTEELNHLLLRLQHALEREKHFSSDAAHELRTPLAGISLHAQLALSASERSKKDHHLEKVLLGVNRSIHIIEQLLTLARMNPESAKKDNQSIALDSTTQLVIEEMEPAIQKKKMRIALKSDKNCYIMAEPVSIQIMIRNLLDNAIRYSTEGDPIHIQVIRQAEYILFSIADHGPGIPAEFRQRVLDRFFRILGSKQDGAGLGLSIVQRIAENHGATIELHEHSETQHGLLVKVFFPAYPSVN